MKLDKKIDAMDVRNSPSPRLEALSPGARRKGVLVLLVVLGLWTTIWLVVLPRISKIDRFHEYHALLEEQGIDPGAIFYTEHAFAFTEKRDISR